MSDLIRQQQLAAHISSQRMKVPVHDDIHLVIWPRGVDHVTENDDVNKMAAMNMVC